MIMTESRPCAPERPTCPFIPLMRSHFFLGLLLIWSAAAGPLAASPILQFTPGEGRQVLVGAGDAPPLWVDKGDYAGVLRAVGDLQGDLEKVTGLHSNVVFKAPTKARMAVIVGTIGRSRMVDGLIRQGKLDVSGIQGRWEAHVTQVVKDPFPGVERALVIAGSDKRGSIYGVYEVSEQAGVSPWAWWADVPVRRRDALYVSSARMVEPGPAVKYRGIFLNDEEPSLGGWARDKFGGFNSRFYAKVFELILRLKGNYLWPAMWGSAFNEDDPANAALADEFGIVMGTSHHEPMLRAQQEWARHGSGPWNFAHNAETLKTFWAEGIRRNRNFESLITVGMRGDGDLPMEEEANVSLLEGIVAQQRSILERETGKPAAQTPQLWALYKEVQGYFEKGMKVPDDVTLLWCDDNWGNIRRLPTPAERLRPGGAGIYYHFDYVGGPRNYKWLHTVPLPKVWEQMSRAHAYGADRIWIVNVGDLKPMELPIEFFLRLAWNPDAIPAEGVSSFVRDWAAREFGEVEAREIADIVSESYRFNGRRKPELLSPETFSLVNGQEAERVVEGWKHLERRAEAVAQRLPADLQDAYYQLVLHSVKACRVVNEMLVTAGFNRLYAEQGRASTNRLAARVRELFREDAALTQRYHALNGGKWNHFMDQVHLGYTMWQQPAVNAMPAVSELQTPEAASMAVAIEGSSQVWQRDDGYLGAARLPVLSAAGARRIEVFNQGLKPFHFQARADAPWLRVTPESGEVSDVQSLSVSVDGSKVPEGATEGQILVSREGQTVTVHVPIAKPLSGLPKGCFLECGGEVAMEAVHASQNVAAGGVQWREIPGYGRTLSGMSPFPLAAPSFPVVDGPFLEYAVGLSSIGDWNLKLVAGPSLNFVPGRGLRVAVSVDEQTPVVLDLLADRSQRAWDEAVANAVRTVQTKIQIQNPGLHHVRVHMVDPGLVLERVELTLPDVNRGGVKARYLGPVESPLR